jgi:hypothetical protein
MNMYDIDITASEALMDELDTLVAGKDANLVIYTLITFCVNGIMLGANVSSEDAHSRLVNYAASLDFRAPADNDIN